MNNLLKKYKFIMPFLGLLAVGFGLLTIKSGAYVLFGGEAGKQFAGNYIPFVLWFNFFAGFFYILAGVGIFFRKKWSSTLAKILAILTLLVFLAFGVVVFFGQEYELRTVGAMSMRLTVWTFIAFLAKRVEYPIHNN